MNKISQKKVIFWDWNGTILDDSGICITAMNKLLNRYRYPEISRNTYEQHFDFPVSNYYQKIGWQFERHPFEQVGLEFMDIYKENIGDARLQQGVLKTFDFLKKSGKKQYLISAMEHDLLIKLTDNYHLHDVFDGISGIEDHYGGGKEHVFEKVIQQQTLNKADIMMIGDTLHDAEIADNLGIDCLLFYSGHQSMARLAHSKHQVIKSYEDLNRYL